MRVVYLAANLLCSSAMIRQIHHVRAYFINQQHGFYIAVVQWRSQDSVICWGSGVLFDGLLRDPLPHGAV